MSKIETSLSSLVLKEDTMTESSLTTLDTIPQYPSSEMEFVRTKTLVPSILLRILIFTFFSSLLIIFVL